MKKLSAVLMSAIMVLGLFTGCNQSDNNSSSQSENADPNALKTGLAVVTSLAGSKGSVDGAEGVAKYDITLAAVTVDSDGVIESCTVDVVATDVSFDASGAVTTDLSGELLSKYDLGENYGMKAYGGSTYEWYEQADALAEYAVGKTVSELREGAVGETGYSADADLATTASIYLGGYVDAIEQAVNNADYIGAKKGDTLSLANINTVTGTDASADGDGSVKLESSIAVVNMDGDTITACIVDALQVSVSFNTEGLVTTDPSTVYKTKNELKEDYGMKAYGRSTYEWYEQAAALAGYAVGKTVDEFKNSAIDETGYAADADLATTATIYLGGYVSVIEKAVQK